MKDLAIIFSDVHIDTATAGVPRTNDVMQCLGEIWEYWKATSETPGDRPILIFGGDICDPGERSHAALHHFAKWLFDDEFGGLDFFAIDGNHDIVEDGSGASVLSALCTRWTLDEDGESEALLTPDKSVALYDEHHIVRVLPYTARSHSYDPIDVIHSWQDNPPDVVIGHLNLEGMIHGSETDDMPRGRDVFWPVEELEKLYPDAILIGGHYHRQQDKEGIHIIGAPGDFTFGDERKPGDLPASFTVIYEDKGKLGVKRVPFEHQRQVMTIRKLPADIGELALKPNAIVRLAIETAPTSAVMDLRAELEKRVEQVVIKGQRPPEWMPVTDPDEIAKREELSAKDAAIAAAREFPGVDAKFREDCARLVELIGLEASTS